MLRTWAAGECFPHFSSVYKCPEYRDIEITWPKTVKDVFSMFYTLIKHMFSINQSVRRDLSIL